MIQINGLSVGSRLLPMSFTCERGEIVHLVGPNGSGKSTLLAAIAGVETFLGQVVIDDTDTKNCSLEDLALLRAFLSQTERPAFNIPVFRYLALSIPTHCIVQQSVFNDVIREVAQEVQIEDKLHRSIFQLSGGEWQRVRLAGICLQIWPSINPLAKLLLLDEPAASLDIGQEKLLYKLIQKVADKGISVVMANHDLNRSLKHADKAIMLERGVVVNSGRVSDVINAALVSRVFKTKVTLERVNGSNILIFE